MNDQGMKSLPILRLIIFTLEIFIISVWVNYHLRLTEWGAIIFSLVPVLLVVMSLIQGAFTAAQESAKKSLLQKALTTCLSVPILVILGLVILITGNFISSITLYADGVTNPVEFQIKSEGQSAGDPNKELQNKNDIKSSLRFTNPFGKSYFIEATGYLRYSFELYPWVGKRIKIGRDLTMSPSLYIRLPGHFSRLANGTLKIVVEGDTVQEVTLGDKQHAAILLGRKKTIPADWDDNWRNYLIRKNVPLEIREEFVAGWQNYLFQQPGFTLIPDQEISFVFYNHIGKQTANRTIMINNKSIQDYLID